MMISILGIVLGVVCSILCIAPGHFIIAYHRRRPSVHEGVLPVKEQLL